MVSHRSYWHWELSMGWWMPWLLTVGLFLATRNQNPMSCRTCLASSSASTWTSHLSVGSCLPISASSTWTSYPSRSTPLSPASGFSSHCYLAPPRANCHCFAMNSSRHRPPSLSNFPSPSPASPWLVLHWHANYAQNLHEVVTECMGFEAPKAVLDIVWRPPPVLHTTTSTQLDKKLGSGMHLPRPA